MLKICSESFSDLQIHRSFYLLSALNKFKSTSSEKPHRGDRLGVLPCTYYTFYTVLCASPTLFYLILIRIIRCRYY